MRRNRELNTWEKKDLARRKYAERQLDKFIKWSIETKGYLKYKDGTFDLAYNFPKDKFELYSNRLKQLEYEKNPKNAIYTAMSIGIAKYLYKLRTNSEENIYNFEKNPFQRFKEPIAKPA